MENRSRNKLNNQIELTSLLDIIFIVLMVVMLNQKINLTAKTRELDEMRQAAVQTQQEADERLLEAEDELEKAAAEEKLLREHREAYEIIDSGMGIITVCAVYTPSDPSHRSILVRSGNEETTRIDMDPSNAGDAFGRLESYLEGITGEAFGKNIPVVLTIDTERILYRDEKTLEEMIGRLSARYDNLYMKTVSGD